MSSSAYLRFPVVVYRFLPLVIAFLRDRNRFLLFGRSRQPTSEQREKRAERLLETLVTLGPTFIKLGQILSTRPDVLPAEYIAVLSRLQDDVPPAPWAESKQVLESELGPVDEVFDEFDREPISGASLGQVYVATYEGQRVAVKVRRPGIESLVEADLRVINWLLPVLARLVGQGQAFSLENLADEFEKTITQEMDYERERRVLTEIRDNFAESDRIVIPEAVPTASTGRVLTMEYVPGTKITDVETLDRKGIDRTNLAETLQRVYLQMIAQDGVFHADPHPGNLSVTDDGRIIFYDFGMSGRVDPFLQEKIIDFYIAVANQDIDAILDALTEMGTLSPEADREVMADVMELAIADVRGEQIEQYRVQQVIDQVESTIYEFPLRLPQNMALVLRVATVVEGVCVTLDPEFDFIAVATDYLQEQGYLEETARRYAREAANRVRETTSALVDVPPRLASVLEDVQRERVTVNVNIEDPDDVLDRLAKRISYSILTAVGILAAAIALSFRRTQIDLIFAVAVLVLTVPVAFLLYRAFRPKRGIRGEPQFTRQNLMEREEGGETEGPAMLGGDEPMVPGVVEGTDDTEDAEEGDAGADDSDGEREPILQRADDADDTTSDGAATRRGDGSRGNGASGSRTGDDSRGNGASGSRTGDGSRTDGVDESRTDGVDESRTDGVDETTRTNGRGPSESDTRPFEEDGVEIDVSDPDDEE